MIEYRAQTATRFQGRALTTHRGRGSPRVAGSVAETQGVGFSPAHYLHSSKGRSECEVSESLFLVRFAFQVHGDRRKWRPRLGHRSGRFGPGWTANIRISGAFATAGQGEQLDPLARRRIARIMVEPGAPCRRAMRMGCRKCRKRCHARRPATPGGSGLSAPSFHIHWSFSGSVFTFFFLVCPDEVGFT